MRDKFNLYAGVLLFWCCVGGVQAQTCESQSIVASTPDSQLLDNGDGTVTDTRTGLMWKQCSEGLTGSDCAAGEALVLSWTAALQQVQSVNAHAGFAGYNDWRLPSIKELSSLIEVQCTQPAINLSRFPNTPLNRFYSSSAVAGSPNVWTVSFGTGDVESLIGRAGDNNITILMRLVRMSHSGPGTELVTDSPTSSGEVAGG